LVTTARDTPREHHREFLWLMGVIGALLVIGVAILITVVLLYRSGNIRGHPQPTATPAATASPVAQP
jgi:hypothetical protein